MYEVEPCCRPPIVKDAREVLVWMYPVMLGVGESEIEENGWGRGLHTLGGNVN